MKRLCIALVLVLASVGLFSQNLNYMGITEVASANRVAVVDMDDFLKIIRDNKVKNVFFSADQFVVQIDAVLYTIESAGFKTIEDYRSGKEKFADGDAYYTARRNGLKTRAEVEYFRVEQFLSGEDYQAALKAGFVNNSIKPKPAVVAGVVRKADLQKRLYFANALFALTLFKDDEQKEKEGILKNKDIPYLVNFGKGSIKALNKDLYYLNIRTDKRAESLEAKINRIFDKKGRNNKDAILYYMAMLSQYKTASEYQAAISAGDATIKGTKELSLAAGFKSLSDVERAIATGFTNGVEYSLAMDYGLKDSAEYGAVKDKINEYEKIRKTYGLKTRIEAFVVDKMLALPKDVPISLERFSEQYNAAMAEDKLLNKSSYKINETFLANLFNMTPSLGKLFAYEADGKSMQRK